MVLSESNKVYICIFFFYILLLHKLLDNPILESYYMNGLVLVMKCISCYWDTLTAIACVNIVFTEFDVMC